MQFSSMADLECLSSKLSSGSNLLKTSGGQAANTSKASSVKLCIVHFGLNLAFRAYQKQSYTLRFGTLLRAASLCFC